MTTSSVSGIRILVIVLAVSGLILSVSADCPCKNKNFASVSSQTNTTDLLKPLSEQSPGLQSAGKLPDNRNFPGASNISLVSGTPILVSSPEPGSYQILSDTPSSASRCTPAETGTEMVSEAAWPAPIITSLSPASVIAGSSSCTLIVDGNYFIPETRVLWDAHDYTKDYLSTYQITAEIPASELGTPGLHYIWVFNPEPCGGQSNISIFQIRDSGRSFPLFTSPLEIRVISGQSEPASIQVDNLPKGLLRYNMTLAKDPGSPFSFALEGFPSWVSAPQATWLDENQMMITGSDDNDRITNTTAESVLVNLSVYGSGAGTGYLQCTLNEAVADDGTIYGHGYTALPVISRELQPFSNPSGASFQVPTDINADGLYEDMNGNGRLDFSDIVIFFSNTSFIQTGEPWWVFDFDQNGDINLNDVVFLFNEI